MVRTFSSGGFYIWTFSDLLFVIIMIRENVENSISFSFIPNHCLNWRTSEKFQTKFYKNLVKTEFIIWLSLLMTTIKTKIISKYKHVTFLQSCQSLYMCLQQKFKIYLWCLLREFYFSIWISFFNGKGK